MFRETGVLVSILGVIFVAVAPRISSAATLEYLATYKEHESFPNTSNGHVANMLLYLTSMKNTELDVMNTYF